MSVICKSPSYIRKWIKSTEGAEAPAKGQTIIGRKYINEMPDAEDVVDGLKMISLRLSFYSIKIDFHFLGDNLH